MTNNIATSWTNQVNNQSEFNTINWPNTKHLDSEDDYCSSCQNLTAVATVNNIPIEDCTHLDNYYSPPIYVIVLCWTGDFVDFFMHCQSGLSPGGLICVKENITKSGVDLDSEDSSVTRSGELLCIKLCQVYCPKLNFVKNHKFSS